MPRKKQALAAEPADDTFINNSDYLDEGPGDSSAVSTPRPLAQNSLPLQDALNTPASKDNQPDDTFEEFSDAKSGPANLEPLQAVVARPASPAHDAAWQPNRELTETPSISPSPHLKESRTSSSSSGQTVDSRLVISKLVLTNFKSYAGVQEIGPFDASFSAVVGPNGSGKSNVIDSMLFVFGFRALKMRQGKLSELIHNSNADQQIEFCQVDIHFMHVIDNPGSIGGALKVPNSDIVISRRAFRTNGSQYYINGKGSTYTDVTSYLRGQGIDLDHKRFLILQGEVESIAQMKAKAEKESDDGLLEYLEDIIGTSEYKPQIESSLAKIEDLNQVCMEKENRFELVESDTKSMEDKKNEALKFLRAEKELTDKRSLKYQTNTFEQRKILAKQDALAEELSVKLESERKKNQEFSRELELAHTEKEELLHDLLTMNKELALTSKRQKLLNNQIVALEEKLKVLTNKIKAMQKAKTASESALSSSMMKLDTMKASEVKCKEDLLELESSLEKEKNILNDLRRSLTNKTLHFSEEIQLLQTKLAPFHDEIQKKESRIEFLKSEMKVLQSHRESIDKKLQDASKRLVDIKAEGKSKEAELETLEKKLIHITDQIGLGEEQVKLFKKNLEGKRVRLASARQKTLDAVNNLATVENKNKVLVALTRLSKSGRITGFYGRLGDLGQIDDKYDVAISTACSALDSMVVETVETAQMCIEYLRKNKLGYANFICLNKLRNFNLGPIQTPGNPLSVKRLFDLITPTEKKFLPAFYSKLHDTLVAGNLQEAKSVAYGPRRYKVVTLDGKLIETSGTMSGGGNASARGGMRLRSNVVTRENDYSEDDITQMKQELAGMELNFENMQTEFNEMELNLRKLKDLKPSTEFAIQTMQLDIQALVQEKKEVSNTCKALIAEKGNSDESSRTEMELSTKQEALGEALKDRDALKLQMLESETRIILLEDKIMEAGGIELKVQNSKVDSIKQLMQIIQDKTSGDKVALKKVENDIKRHTKIVADSDNLLLSAESEKDAVQADADDKRAALNLLQKETEEAQKVVAKKESELEKLESLLEDLLARINEMKSEEIELLNQFEKVQSSRRRCLNSIKDDEEALADLVIRDTSSYLEWMEEAERAIYNSSEIRKLDEDELASINLDDIEREITDLGNYMNEVKVDVEILKEYGIKQLELRVRRDELNSSVNERDAIKQHCEELKRRRLDEFMEGFNTISLSLKEMYQMITMGGNAELELVDSLDPFSEGILFSVMPPKKSWKNISNLSGGEKTLSSLALVFALHKYKPTPLYVMDEIDAALDFRNVSIVANYIKERTRNGQFIVISLRNNMFELAQQLVGIYKVNNMTRSISLKNSELFVEEKMPIAAK